MKWKCRRSSAIKGFWGIEDEDEGRKTICYLDKDIPEAQIRMIENAPQMYELIKEVAETVNIRTFRTQKARQKFIDLITKIDEK